MTVGFFFKTKLRLQLVFSPRTFSKKNKQLIFITITNVNMKTFFSTTLIGLNTLARSLANIHHGKTILPQKFDISIFSTLNRIPIHLRFPKFRTFSRSEFPDFSDKSDESLYGTLSVFVDWTPT